MADNEIGSAYLNVKPKVDGSFGDEIAAHGSAVGSKFGGAFAVAAGNLLSQAFTGLVSAAVDTFVEGFNNYADYEQLTGGVEKIFDQADQAQIFADAANAYKDLNLSANQYLESINQVGAAFSATMGDQKGYDTARKGMKAISDYASGTGRNLDELNQKYALITRSTASYQSIADQFSGILPATSTAFLEQAQAAGFLSDEYTKLTEVPVAEYQEALTLMLQQGVDDLGLAGNTAAETANTISGSLAGLGAAWGNFLTALFDKNADIQPYLDALGEMIGAAFDNIGEAVSTALGRIWEVLISFLSGIGENIGNTLSDILLSITSTISGAFDNILNTAQTVWNAIKTAIETPINAARDIVRGAIEAIKGFFSFKFEWPHIPLPHFSISGSINPIDWLSEGLPQIGIEWYAKGGFVDGATLIGAGENGAEMILPQDGALMDAFADRIAERSDGILIEWLDRNLGKTIADYTPTLSRRDFDRMARGAVA